MNKRRRENRCVGCGGEPLPKYKYDVLVGVQHYCSACKSKYRWYKKKTIDL